MQAVKIVWATPDAEKVMGYCARVSNPANQHNPDVAGLLRYCARMGHWSVFEMASVCIEVNTSRDIARQILRHRSFSFQEFSQRYADVDSLEQNTVFRECRMQDTQNRQNSLPCADECLADDWEIVQAEVSDCAWAWYRWALSEGIAKEQARALLPEGLTPSRMYVTGTVRSWIHYLQSRTDPATQKEHRLIAEQILALLVKEMPHVFGFLTQQQDVTKPVMPALPQPKAIPAYDFEPVDSIRGANWILLLTVIVVALLLIVPFIFSGHA